MNVIHQVVGDEVKKKGSMYKLSYPVQRGIVKNWEEMEDILHYTLHNELMVCPQDHAVLLTEAPLNPKANREKMAEVMFETFNSPALYVEIQSVLVLYASCRTSGIVIDSGDGVTQFVPIDECKVVQHAVDRINLAGTDLTNYLGQMLTERGLYFNSAAEKEMVKSIKENVCHVTDDLEQKQACDQINYELPDGRVITVGNERFRCPEALFQPSILGMDVRGIDELAYNSIRKCTSEIQEKLLGNIILAGGSSCFPGITERMQKEIVALAPPSTTVNVIVPEPKRYSSWIGGSVLASLSEFQDILISKQEYIESGSSVVHSK